MAAQLNTHPRVLKVRAKTFYAEKAGLDVSKVDVPVVGGHAGVTILPLFSQVPARGLVLSLDRAHWLGANALSPSASLRLQAVPNASNKLSDADIDALTKRTQDGGTEVVQAKAGKVRVDVKQARVAGLWSRLLVPRRTTVADS